jgi:hypothetical protein
MAARLCHGEEEFSLVRKKQFEAHLCQLVRFLEWRGHAVTRDGHRLEVAAGEGQTARELAATLRVRQWEPGGNGSVVVCLEDQDTRQEILDYCLRRSAAHAKAREAQATPPDPATALAVRPDHQPPSALLDRTP